VEITRLPANDRPTTHYRYRVTGAGSFPYDMLRYDACWPVDGEQGLNCGERERRMVTMSSYRYPTVDRWRSFLWAVDIYKV